MSDAAKKIDPSQQEIEKLKAELADFKEQNQRRQETEAERYAKLQTAADAQINRAWKAYSILAGLLAIVLTVGVGWVVSIVGKDLKADEKEMTEVIKKDTETYANAQIAAQLTEPNLRNMISNELSKVTDQLLSNKIGAQMAYVRNAIADDLLRQATAGAAGPDKAFEELKLALKLYKQTTNVDGIFKTAIKVGDSFASSNQPDAARSNYEDALNAARVLATVNPQVWQVLVGAMVQNIGEMYALQGDAVAAEKSFKEAWDVFQKVTEESPRNIGITETESDLGHLYLGQQKNDAIPALDRSTNAYAHVSPGQTNDNRLTELVNRANAELKKVRP